MTSSQNPLAAPSLASYITSALPRNASPQIKSPTEAIAVACHAGMLAVGFRFAGLGEDHNSGMPLLPRLSRLSLQGLRTNKIYHLDPATTQPLPAEWNTHPDSLSFRYTHPQSSMSHLLKISRLGSKTLVYGISLGADKTMSFDITTTDFVSETSLPATPVSSNTSPEDATHNVTNIFISPSRLSDLGSQLRLNLIQKLMPSLQKEGYEDTFTSDTTASSIRQGDQPPHPRDPVHDPPRHDPLRDDPMLPRPAQPHHPLADPSIGPRRPGPAGDFPPPGFEDEFEMNRPPRGMPFPRGPEGGRYPNIGDRDLYPPGLGPRDPLRGGGGGLPGLGGIGGGGMHPTFEDLDGREGGVGGMDGMDLRAPPGARYDPPGPGAGPPRGAGGARFGGMGGRPPNPFGGFGDNDFI